LDSDIFIDRLVVVKVWMSPLKDNLPYREGENPLHLPLERGVAGSSPAVPTRNSTQGPGCR